MLSSLLPRRCFSVAVSSLASFSSSPSVVVLSSGFPSSTLFPQQQHTRSLQTSGRSRRGLYDGKDIRSGNNVPFSMKKTRRKWKPNVFIKKLYSETFDTMFSFHVTAAALRSVDKAGGLDHYILKQDFTEGEGFQMKKKLLQRRKNIAYFERKGLQHSSIIRAAAEAAAVAIADTDGSNMDTATSATTSSS